MASSSSSGERTNHPGPVDSSLLHMQESHVSQHIWSGEPDRILIVRRAQGLHQRGVEVPYQILPYLKQAGFDGVAKIDFFQIERNLITALVERWRSETHTFHMPSGECTITLQDVAVQLGLSIDGRPVTGVTLDKWQPLVKRLLGIAPPEEELWGGRLRMLWLNKHFSNVNDHISNEVQLLCYTRAYVLRLMGGIMFPDHSGRYVHLRYLGLLEDFEETGKYSWGSAVLSYLYRELCKATKYDRKEIGGACVLVQLWAWNRFPCIAPTPPSHLKQDEPFGARWSGSVSFTAVRHRLAYYRYKFDTLKPQEIVWEPYTLAMMQKLPTNSLQGKELWRSVVPLICYHIVEWHQPDRVMRQFGMEQHVPRFPLQPDYLHDVTLRGKSAEDWREINCAFIELWDQRYTLVRTNNPQQGLLDSNSEYMKWYTQRTRRWITREGAKIGSLVDSLERMYYYTTEEGRDAFSLDALRGDVSHCLQILGEMKHILEPAVSSPPLNHEIPEPEVNVPIPVGQVEGHEPVHHKRRVVRETSTTTQIEQPASKMYCVPPVTPLPPMPTLFYPSHPPSVDTSSSSTAHPSPIQTSNDYYIPAIPTYYASSAYPPYLMTHLARSPWSQTPQNAPPMPSSLRECDIKIVHHGNYQYLT